MCRILPSRNMSGPLECCAAVRAVGLTEFGDPEVLHVLDLPQPDAGPGQLRIASMRLRSIRPTRFGAMAHGRQS